MSKKIAEQKANNLIIRNSNQFFKIKAKNRPIGQKSLYYMFQHCALIVSILYFSIYTYISLTWILTLLYNTDMLNVYIYPDKCSKRFLKMKKIIIICEFWFIFYFIITWMFIKIYSILIKL